MFKENKVYFFNDRPVMTVGLVEGYKGETVVIYREGSGKLSLINYNDFMKDAQVVEEL